MDLILNEWLWSDLRRENSVEKQRGSILLLLTILDRPDRLVIVQNSPFTHKAWRLSAEARDVEQREMVKLFKNSYLADPKKCLLLDPTELPGIPDSLAGRCKTEDHYLVQAQEAAPGSIVVTTDDPLRKALLAHHRPCRHRDEWLWEYLGVGPR